MMKFKNRYFKMSLCSVVIAAVCLVFVYCRQKKKVCFQPTALSPTVAEKPSGVQESAAAPVPDFVSIPASADDLVPVLAVSKGLSLYELKDILKLSDNQMGRLQPIMQEEKLRRKVILRKYSAPTGKMKNKKEKELEVFRKYYEDMYSHILNEEQFKKYLQVRDQIAQE